MKLLAAIAIVLLLVGCVAPRRAGRAMSSGGQSVAKMGTVIIAASGICPLTIPFCVFSIPFYVIGVPAYYGGAALAHEETEEHPFEL